MNFQVLYLLHYDMPDGSIRHFCGSVGRQRLDATILSHRVSERHRYTGEWIKNGGTCHLAAKATVQTAAWAEIIHHENGHSNLCPVCTKQRKPGSQTTIFDFVAEGLSHATDLANSTAQSQGDEQS